MVTVVYVRELRKIIVNKKIINFIFLKYLIFWVFFLVYVCFFDNLILKKIKNKKIVFE
eukprot:EC820764.1.p2 GENE.EC820764.1~~EC820764.1.p2  ORF type:complete len:58 (-),score=7.05 EC820764.1:9-182(-)